MYRPPGICAYGQLDGRAACLSEVIWPHTDLPDALSDLVTLFGRTFLIPSVCAKGGDSVIVHSFAVDYFLLRFCEPN
jgi:hypothetical protein